MKKNACLVRSVPIFITSSLLMVFFSVTAFAFKLPDTGQTKCYQGINPFAEITCPPPGDSLAQDGSYNINPLSYTENGNGTVTDNNTGLIWQKEDDRITRKWDEAVSYCASLALPGTGWRVPTKKELMSIVDYGIPFPGPTVEMGYFPSMAPGSYCSSTVDTNNFNNVWFVTFNQGDVGAYAKTFAGYVKCVHGEQNPGPSFIDNGDGTVTDSRTGLVWQQDEPGAMTWGSPFSYCEGLDLGGSTSWRLPNIKELESLTDHTRNGPAIDTGKFPNAKSSNYWSSTTYALNSSLAWYVNFNIGSVNYNDRHGSGGVYVRCVRDGEALINVTAPLHDETDLFMTTSDYSNFATRIYFNALGINHSGVDLALSENGSRTASPVTASNPVYAICNGEVDFIYSRGGINSFVKIHHPDCNGQDIIAYYGHITPISGLKTVTKDDPIGTVKNQRGNSHLHLTIDTQTERNLSSVNNVTCDYELDTAQTVISLYNCSNGVRKLANNQMLLRVGWGQVRTLLYKDIKGRTRSNNLYISEDAIRDLGFIPFFDLY